MYFDWRLFGLTRGVRLRILFAAALGLIAVGAGVSRLAVSGRRDLSGSGRAGELLGARAAIVDHRRTDRRA